MQRKACRRFAEQMGWEIICEEQEEGVSGHKVRAEKRDKIQIIKEHALQGKFDILLVFMFDRIGRIADETPFVVEWLVKNGIRVWSVQEGEQRFDTHTDKLLNYIRFWQADGESVKTSLRTKTRLGQIVEEGHFKGGIAAYGYHLIKSGRYNKKKHELYDLEIDQEEATVVKLMFNKSAYEGYGAQRISTFLNEHGYRARSGKNWHPATIRGILKNPLYTGILRSGESRSDCIASLQIISKEQFQTVQEILAARSNRHDQKSTIPLNTRGRSLLAGNVFCGHCGARLTLTTNGKYRKRADGSVDKTPRIRYICYGKTRKQTACTGPTGYTMHRVDAIIDRLIREILCKVKGASKQELISARYEKEVEERKAHLLKIKTELKKAADESTTLKAEVVRCIQGQSAFSKELLASMIMDLEKKCEEYQTIIDQAEKEIEDKKAILNAIYTQYDELISWAELYDTATQEAKKMIVSSLIKRVDVFRDYKLHVEFCFDLNQFYYGLDVHQTENIA